MERAPVFISWSGDASRATADALRSWLPKVLQTVDPFVSSQDIAAGNVWFDSIGSQLRRSEFAIICVTRDNLDSPWLHFEAGAIGVAHGTEVDSVPRSVVPLLLDVAMSDLDPPLSLYQALSVSEPDVRKLVTGLNGIAPAPLSDSHLKETFDRWWPDLEADLKTAQSMVAPAAAKRPQRTERELLEELLSFARHSGFAASTSRRRDPSTGPAIFSHPALSGFNLDAEGRMEVRARDLPGMSRKELERELASLALQVPGATRVRITFPDELTVDGIED